MLPGPELIHWHWRPEVMGVLLLLGGVIYTIGALGFARRWPTLKPSVFSYHEVWHLCTLTAAAAHLAAVWIVAA